MSLNKSTRRVALFTSSSLIAAGLTAAVSLGAASLPTAAAAQSVCTPTPTSGAGTNTVTYSSGNQTTGISCTATGNFILNKTAGNVSSTSGFALNISSTGTATVNQSVGSVGGVNFNMPNGSGVVNFSGAAGGATFNLAGATNISGRWLGSGANVFGAGNDTINFQGIGHNFLGGRGALAEASIDLGAGNDTINLAAFLNIGGHVQEAGSIDFGTGNDTFNISGVFTSHGGELANLEALNLSGTIFMGPANTGGNNPAVIWDRTDGVADDILRISGAAFTGSDDARIVMDVNIGAGFQQGCAAATGVADCLDLRGGSTAGVTVLTLNNLAPDALLAGYDLTGITLVDVGGGTSAAGHFVLDPDTAGFASDPLYGDVISRPGIFVYTLQYDPETQRHAIVGLPRGEVLEYAILSGAAQSIWHMTAGTVTDRQTDLRRGEGGSVWVRATGEFTDREAETSFDALADIKTIDTGYQLYAGAIIGGIDLISGRSGGMDYALGGQIGYIGSSFELNEGSSSGQFTGATGGVYGSAWNDRFFVDATVNLNGLALNHEQPGLGAKTETFVNSIGAAAEAGVRATLTANTFAEPLVSVSWVRTSFEEISLNGGEVEPGDAESLRGALGLRLGATLPGENVSATWFVTGRAWNEFEGETGGVIHNLGADLPFADAFTGAFGEAELGINVFNAANTLSAFATTGVKWKEGYSAVDLALGVRIAW